MIRKFSFAIIVAIILGLSLPSLVLAAVPTAHISFTTDAPCAVTVIVTSYTDPTGNQPGITSGSTPWTLDTAPSTSVAFVYPKAITCNGVSYVWQSTSPSNPITSGADGSITTVTGHYLIDTTPPVWTVPASFSVEATGATGAIVTYIATASDPDDTVKTQSCSPASGSIFALGTTTVHCTAADTNGNTGTASFDVTVVDTTPPSLTLPSNITTNASSPSGIVVNFTASATDLVDNSVAVTCQPASGSTFAVGTTTVNCSATDAHKNTANGSFTVTVTFADNTPPTVTVPADIVAEATGPSGAVVNFTASANDSVDGAITPTCTPASGSTFALGITTVNCSATDSHGNMGTASFHVTVGDTTAPTLNLPANITVDTTDASGTAVSFTASATDLVDGPVSITCIPASGLVFPIGQTTVNCSATDAHKNTANGSFTVTVTLTIVDITPPTVTVPADIAAEATGLSGAVVSFIASANDNVDGTVVPTCSPAAGSTFPLGTTLVTCTATDTHNNTGTASFNVTVVDTTAPALTLPSDMTVDATSASGADVSFTASAVDLVDGSVFVTCSPASGSTFPFGTKTVNCSATDAHNNTVTGSFNVTVVDQIPPTLNLPGDMAVTALNASGAKVNFSVSANDAVDGPAAVTCSPAAGSWFPIGVTVVNCSAVDSHDNQANGSFTVAVQYASSDVKCNGVAGHQILQPINTDGSSVFKQGSTVPAKFRICGSDGKAIGDPGVVTGFTLLNDRAEILSANSDTTFRSGNAQWIFNIDTKNLTAGNTYIYLITLNDGSTIQFQFTLK
jgi:large repetitive protein